MSFMGIVSKSVIFRYRLSVAYRIRLSFDIVDRYRIELHSRSILFIGIVSHLIVVRYRLSVSYRNRLLLDIVYRYRIELDVVRYRVSISYRSRISFDIVYRYPIGVDYRSITFIADRTELDPRSISSILILTNSVLFP